MRITVSNNKHMKDSLAEMYRQTEVNATILIDVPKNSNRPPRPNEKLYDRFKKFTVVTEHCYKLLQPHLNIIRSFLDERIKYRIWFADEDSVNFLNPGRVICPISACRKEVVLKIFNCHIHCSRHLGKHKVNGESLSNVLLQRFHFLNETNWWHDWRDDISGAIDALELRNHHEFPLAIKHMSRYIVRDNETDFTGKCMLMTEDACKKMLNPIVEDLE